VQHTLKGDSTPLSPISLKVKDLVPCGVRVPHTEAEVGIAMDPARPPPQDTFSSPQQLPLVPVSRFDSRLKRLSLVEEDLGWWRLPWPFPVMAEHVDIAEADDEMAITVSHLRIGPGEARSDFPMVAAAPTPPNDEAP
jgi:hypothetical protein